MAKEKIAVPTVEELQAQLASKEQELLNALAVNEQLSATIEDLQRTGVKPAAVKTVAKVPTESFEVGHQSFVFTVPAFHYGGGRVTAAEALQRPDLLKELVDLGFGGIKRAGDQ